MISRRIHLWIGVFVLCFSVIAFANPQHDKDKKGDDKKAAKKGKKEKSLYQRLGGGKAITAVVDDFVGRVAEDKRINSFFANANIPHLKGCLVKQIGQAAGGPEKYDCKNMKTAHKGMGIKEEHFNALVEDLVAALDKFKVGKKEQDELLGVLGPMKTDIVE